MSEVSPEAELGSTSAEDLQVDCQEDDKSDEGLSEDIKPKDVDNCRAKDEAGDVMYDIDIDGAREDNAESGDKDEQMEKDGVCRQSVVTYNDGNVESSSGATQVPRSLDNGAVHSVDTAKTPQDNGDVHAQTKESTMTEESHKSSAAEIPVTINGDLDQNPDTIFQRDYFPSGPGALNLSESGITSRNFASTTEGIIESGPHRGAMKAQPESGAVVLAGDLKSPAMEKLDLVRKWSINTYKCTRQILSEKLGRGSRTVDLELEAQIEVLRDNKRKYQNVIRLAQTLASQLSQIMQTQRQLGDAFADLSLKSPELHEEFGFNADTQKLLSKNGEALLSAITFFISSVNTLVDKTIEDTMINIKQYEAARVEYDAYRTDLEELNLGPRDTATMPKIEQSQQQFQIHREKYERMRSDVSIKLKFLEENKVKVLHNQLILFHNAIAAYYAGNQQQLEQTLKQFCIKSGGESPSWLEEH
ncbi:arfaptin-1 isoform X2 [Thalassophryne amazonica]|uniref:arfaptin-1 isoform X2 n=1 Tax=Thalassophryne amazonica TaxID=390379 RepID=UPI001472016A|nr:arfaptin-1 isoform X2 [Thalassophryne amazonica]